MNHERFDQLHAMAEIQSSALIDPSDFIEALDEIARLAGLVYVPGRWHCPKCKFHLTSSILYVKTGNIGINRKTPDPCPNDGMPLEPNTWEQDAKEMSEHMLSAACMDRINILRENDGSSVTILCDNQDGPPNNVIEVCDEWTGWEPRRFEGIAICAHWRPLIERENRGKKIKEKWHNSSILDNIWLPLPISLTYI